MPLTPHTTGGPGAGFEPTPLEVATQSSAAAAAAVLATAGFVAAVAGTWPRPLTVTVTGLAVATVLSRRMPASVELAVVAVAVTVVGAGVDDGGLAALAAAAAAGHAGLQPRSRTLVAAAVLAVAFVAGRLPWLADGRTFGLDGAAALLPAVLIPVLAVAAARLREHVQRQAGASALSHSVAATAVRLAALQSAAAMHRCLVDGVREIAGPWSAVAVLSADGTRTLTSSVVGLEGRSVTAGAPAAVADALQSHATTRLRGAAAAAAAQDLGLPRTHQLVVVPVGDGTPLAVLVAGAADLDDDDVRAVEALAAATAHALPRVTCSDALHLSDARYAGVVHDAPDVVLTADLGGHISYVNPAVQAVLGYEPQQMAGQDLVGLAKPEMAGRLRALLLIAADSGLSTGRLRLRHADGSWRHCEVRGARLERPCGPECPVHEGEGPQVIITIRDVTERVALEEDLAHRAFHDSLTDLPNRALLTDRVEQALRATRRTGKQVAVMLCDLDDFKTINDTLGHQVGDHLLVEMASRLRECIRPGDTGARLGGDEFAVLLENVSDSREAEKVAARLLEILERPFQLGPTRHAVGASIGVALAGAGETTSDLLRKADIAMYVAKRRGKHRFEVFREDSQDGSLERLQRLAEMQSALERGEFVTHYQPTIDLDRGTIVGVEALVRWQHPEHGLLPPSEFIPLAEESGLIVPIGGWVLREACDQVSRWQHSFGRAAPAEVSVNLSVVQLARDDLVVEVAETLDGAKLGGSGLTLEITESGLMTDMALSARRLSALKRLGVNLAVDDFGTGYSSLAYLQQFPIDTLKIDRTFVDGVDGSAENSALAKAIVRLGHELNLRTVAEGIERSSQVDALRRLRCPVGQGFYFSEPLSAVEVESLLHKG